MAYTGGSRVTAGTTILGATGATTWLYGIANAAAGADYSPLYNLGAIGVVLAWLMWRVEPRMKAMEAALDRATRATMLMLIARPEAAEAVKEQSKGLVEECSKAEEARNK